MSEVTGQDLAHAALRRLSAKEGTGAAQALLERLGIASVSSIPESAIDEILAACPELPRGEGVMVASGDKPKGVRETINDMGADRNAKVNAAKQGEDVSDAMKTVLDGPGGFDAAGKAMNARGGLKSAKK